MLLRPRRFMLAQVGWRGCALAEHCTYALSVGARSAPGALPCDAIAI